METNRFLAIANGVAQSNLLNSNQPPIILPAPAPEHAEKNAEKPRQTVSQLTNFVKEVENLWADDAQFSSQTQLVQYSSDKRTRSLIDLKEGKLIIEHLASPNAELVMHRILTNALLTPDDPRKVDLLSTQPVSVDNHPFLFGQLVDSLGKPIDTVSKAQTFAAWAIVHKSQTVQTPSGPVQRVELALDANHKQVRAARFAHNIEAAAREFGLDANLLYAIMETESHFNPFAVSRTGALGLMQIMPERAGRDAMKLLTGVSRAPTQAELIDPKTNIRLGAAYVALLQQHYLKAIEHPRSREYAVIAAYNGGASRAIAVFSDNPPQAMRSINALPPQMVYDSIKRRHASAETRGYLEKVTTAKSRYSNRV
ncbi:MAG TPA: murein transglycosylase domain-containing protein [Thiotrichales bacterium]|nr:murein transglycosylase domain-containing protein [Thiotrichales bacterium]